MKQRINQLARLKRKVLTNKANGIWAASRTPRYLEEKIGTEELHYPIVRPGAVKQWGQLTNFDKKSYLLSDFWQQPGFV